MLIALCEDKPEEMANLQALLKEYAAGHPQLRLHAEAFTGAELLLEAVRGEVKFHIFLLDIFMPGMDGIELSRRLRAAGQNGEIIFITGSRDYALEAFGVQAIDYLLKPVGAGALFAALDHAVQLLDSRKDALYTLVQMADADRMVPLGDIVAVEVQGHTLCYYLTTGERLNTKVLRISFGKATVDLIDNERFMRPHQSYLVNADHVVSVGKKKLAMDTGMEVPVSRQRFTDFKSRYIAYLTRRGEPL